MGAEQQPAAGFFSRWSRRKTEAQEEARAAEVVAPPEPPPEPPIEPAPAATSDQPALTLDDVARLRHESDFSPFVARGVDEDVKRAAMKKLFSDPHFNVMDGLDIYIDDYSQPDPIPPAMLRMMNQSQFLGLFDHEKQEEEQDRERAPTAQVEPPAAQPHEALATASHDHPDLRLQQDDAPGQPAADPGARA
jgi:Protein of unknown function (DUF3306)